MASIKDEFFSKIQLFLTLVLILFLAVTGTTYAYFAITDTNNNTITGDLATVNLTLDVEKIFPTSTSDNTGVIVPQLSVSGSENSPLATALKSGCVDSNKNVVCQVYKINIQNVGGSATQVVDGSIFFYGNVALTDDVNLSMPNLRWKLITLADEMVPTNSTLGTNDDLVANASDGNIFANDVTMLTGASFDYYIIIWINENNADQTVDEGNSFYAKVEFNSSNGTGVTASFGS